MNSDPIKFLLVDDIEENLIALEALLRREGLELLKARSAREALELLLVHDVALALLDVQMPEMDGFELAELMRGAERTKHIPIIFVTAGAHDQQRVFKGYETGAVDFLFKPIDPRVLKGKADVFYELYRQRTEYAHALRLNEMFVGILGHDLRNPLGAVMMGAQLLEHQLPEEGHRRTVKRMLSAGQRMNGMIDQLLDLTRARLAGGLGFMRVRSPIEVAALVQRTLDELRIAHPECRVVMETIGDSSTSGDPDRLLQLFSNLLANALHHGAKGKAVKVVVDGSVGDIVVEVTNDGAIAPELLPSVFDPFRRRETKTTSGGLGLGLFICQQIVLAHGGAISVHSTESEGTTFSVRLPRRVVSERQPAALSEGARTVLIVEDDESVRESLREVFQEEGYETALASNGREALDQLKNGIPRPDIVILDLVLPVLDGWRVYETMQADPELAAIPVIATTADPARAPSGLVVVPKPPKLTRLLSTVAAALRGSPPR
jgi:signal transduction histidine kinase